MVSLLVAVLLGYACAPPAEAPAPRSLAYRLPESSPQARLAQLLRGEYASHRQPGPRDNVILFGLQTHRYSGSAQDLNRFLADVAKLGLPEKVIVTLTGPRGHDFVTPLTAAAAQASADYDWHVQQTPGALRISVPLASRIPFASIRVPSELTVEAGMGAPAIVKTWSELHNAAR